MSALALDDIDREVGRAFHGEAPTRANGRKSDQPLTSFPLEGPEDFFNLRRPRFVVPGLIPENGTFLLFAPSGAYKTTLMVSVLVMAANGKALDGSVIDPVPLVIVANEDAHGVKLRLRALAEKMTLSLTNVRVLATGEFRIDLEEHRDRLVLAAQQAFPGQRPALLVDHYDVSVTEKPTDPDTGAKARDGLRDLIQRGFACAGFLAHTPWTTADRAKLPVSLWANMDARFGMQKRDDGTAEFFVEHCKNGESGFTLAVRLVKVTLELEDGSFETVAAEIETDPNGAPVRSTKRDRARKRELSTDQRTALKAIARATCDHAMPTPLAGDIPRKAVGTSEVQAIATIARLVPRCTNRGKDRTNGQQKEHAARLLSALHKDYFVRLVDGFCWLDPRAEEFIG